MLSTKLMNRQFLSLLLNKTHNTLTYNYQNRLAFSQQTFVNSLKITKSQQQQQPHQLSDQSSHIPIELQKNKSHYQNFPIQKYQIGQRFDRYLKTSHHNSNLNWTMIQKFIRNKQIYILNIKGQKIKHNDYRLQQGDMLYIKKNIIKQLFSQNNKMNHQIPNIDYHYAKGIIDKLMIFDNKNITVLNKPSGYSVQGGYHLKQNLFTLMAVRYKKQFVYVSHRLDKPTTGVLFFCKNLKTAQLVQSAMESRKQYNKYYLALTLGGKINKKQDYIRCNVQWTNKHKARIIQSLQKEDSKDCITYYNKLYQQQNSNNINDNNITNNNNITNSTNKQMVNLLGMKLITGRKHQLRCHLSGYLDNPIINDQRYGGKIIKLQNKSKSINQQISKQTNQIFKQSKQTQITQIINNYNNNEQKQLKQIQLKQQNDSIYLHALMTTIKSQQLILSAFQIQQKQLINSKKSSSSKIISHNQNGILYLKQGNLKIVGTLPNKWKSLQSKSSKFKLNFEFNQIQIAEEIQKSQNYFNKKHKLNQKIMTLE